MENVPEFKNTDEANKYFMDIYNKGGNLPEMEVKIIHSGGFTSNLKKYRVKNVLGMIENSDLGTVHADNIEAALRKAKRENPNPSYLLQVTLEE